MIMYEVITKGGHPLLGLDFYHSLDMSLGEFKETMMHITSDFEIIKKTEIMPK